jgi:hypothetical protein
MKIIFALVLVLVLLPKAVLSQGALYLSNLGESSSGGYVGGGSQNFETGEASSGYILNSVTLQMGGYAPIASNFSVSIYSDNSGQVGVSVGLLSGNSDPETAGQYIYAASGIVLNSTTTYWIVAVCDSSSSNPLFPPGGYIWPSTMSSNYVSEDGWKIDNSGNPEFPTILQFALNATPVPEPSTVAIVGLGLIAVLRRRKN